MSADTATSSTATIDTTLEDSLNDEIIDSESNNVLELQEEIWRLQEEIENRDFEIERYAKIIMTRMRDDDQFMKDGDTEHGLCLFDRYNFDVMVSV